MDKTLRWGLFWLAAALAASAILLASSTQAASPDVVIGQVYGGGNSKATLRNDFLALFNRGSALKVDSL